MTTLYRTSATATHEGRNGRVTSADGLLDVAMAMPKELGGAGGATNPEQLFAAGYAACFTSAMQLVARESKRALGAPTVTAHVGLDKEEDGFHLTVLLDIALPDVAQADAEDIVRKAHGICPYSRATRSDLDVGIRLVGWQGAGAGDTRVLENA